MKLFAWCDSPTAPTGFGRSARHVLMALHEAGYEIVQLAVNYDPATRAAIPWKVYAPSSREHDAYGLGDLHAILQQEQPDLFWSTFDPEVPWKYGAKGTQSNALDLVRDLRALKPGFKMLGWFPVDGGPLSNFEMAVLGLGENLFDKSVTMSPHVHDLIQWSLELREKEKGNTGVRADRAKIEAALPVIPHGVDLEGYTIPTPEQRREAKKRLGVDPDGFLILQLERNQQRKQNYLSLEVLEILRKQPLAKNVQLYLHLQPDEENAGCMVGYNLPEMAWRYGLKMNQDVFFPPGFVSEEELILRYQAADCFYSASTGEGFQYPAWEALAMGIPLVVPNDSARKAWFTGVPNVHLYDVIPHRLVLRGGYCRRMSYPKPEAAATIIRKMVKGQQKYQPKPEAGRAFVEKTANVAEVQRAWVELVNEQRDALIEERKRLKVALPGSVQFTPQNSEEVVHVSMLHNPGIGDVLATLPGLRALRAGGAKVRLEIQRPTLELVQVLDAADEYVPSTLMWGQHEQIRTLAHRYVQLHDFHHPVAQPGWHDPTVSRAALMAERMGAKEELLTTVAMEVPDQVARDTAASFRDQFGVDLTSCVGIALESGSPARSLPSQYVHQLLPHLRALELTPVIFGSKVPDGEQMIRHTGVIDLREQTQLPVLIGMLGKLRAMIATDSGPMHLAALYGTPLVACFTTVLPEARLGQYEGEIRTVTPERSPVAGEAFPMGEESKAPPGAWGQEIRPATIAAALRDLLGEEDSAPTLSLVR